jgi:hypothetical protein
LQTWGAMTTPLCANKEIHLLKLFSWKHKKAILPLFAIFEHYRRIGAEVELVPFDLGDDEDTLMTTKHSAVTRTMVTTRITKILKKKVGNQ